MNILIVDDNETNLKFLGAILEAEGHQVTQAGDGVEALALLDRDPIDAVISDILMPRMDGYRLCFEVRRRGNLHAVPFIVYSSTYTTPSDEKTALGLGADIFLRKPAPAGEILEALAKAIQEAPKALRGESTETREVERLKEYSEALVAKLEQRNAELHDRAETLRQSEEKLKQSRGQLRLLAQRLQAAREEERVRIARELHDGMGGLLMGIEIGLTWMQGHLGRKEKRVNREELLARTIEMDKLARDTANRIRQLCTELRPSILDDLGLGPAIEWQSREFQQRTSIRCTLKLEGELTGHIGDANTAIFRIFQEVLTNVARHAQASKVRVHIRQTGSELVMEIRDNGIGIRPEQVTKARSLGLLGMQERVDFLGGTILIRGEPGKGTFVSVTVPIAPTATQDLQ